jgi:hypothetical protein
MMRRDFVAGLLSQRRAAAAATLLITAIVTTDFNKTLFDSGELSMFFDLKKF